MKIPIKIILLMLLILIITKPVNAQSKVKYDTVYYFFDLSHIPINDRMISIDSEKNYKFYTINCPCLKAGEKPTLRLNTTRVKPLSNENYKKIKFISLPKLIDIIKRNGYEGPMKKYVMYFVQSSIKGFTRNEVFLEKYDRSIIIDYDTVKPDTSKNKKPK